MLIREFQLDDYEPVVELWRKAGIHIDVSDSPEGIRHKLTRDPDLFLVAVEDGVILGTVMGCYDGRRGWINHLAVLPQNQKSGLGTLLMGTVEARFKEKGCVKINLHILPENEGVGAFYEHLGYNRDVLIFMEKWL